jgi:hypothetical protein
MGRPPGSTNNPNRKPVDFRQGNVKRIIRAAQAMGLNVSGIEVDPGTGKIRVLVGDKPGEPDASEGNEWDAEMNRMSK